MLRHQPRVPSQIIRNPGSVEIYPLKTSGSLKILGDSRKNLQQHFKNFIQTQLDIHKISFDRHPLLLPFIETHAHELTEFVIAGVALEHQFSMKAFEKLSGDPMKLFRVDLWDSLSAHIQNAEAHFISNISGLQQILHAATEECALRDRQQDDV